MKAAESTMPVESHNVTHQDQIALLREQLARAQRLSALGELTSTTAHEFNNILTTIINYAKMGLRHHDTGVRDKAFQKILDAGTRAARITGSILGVARNRGSKLEPVDLARLIDDTLLLLEREMNKYHVAIERQFQPVPPVMANGNQIQQILMNLLINARQAMPSGGRVILKLLPDPEHEMVDLVVRDTGCGIDPENLRRIFDPFFTTKKGPDDSGKGGTGLGLASCREIIEAHHGRIRVESAPGKGTAFTIKLPVAKPSHDRTPVSHAT
jgi:signal transduction histidine kinase